MRGRRLEDRALLHRQVPETSKQSNSEGCTFAECAFQTKTILTLTAADIKWAPTIETFVDDRRSDKSKMSSLGSAIIAQQHDELPAPIEQ